MSRIVNRTAFAARTVGAGRAEWQGHSGEAEARRAGAVVVAALPVNTDAAETPRRSSLVERDGGALSTIAPRNDPNPTPPLAVPVSRREAGPPDAVPRALARGQSGRPGKSGGYAATHNSWSDSASIPGYHR